MPALRRILTLPLLALGCIPAPSFELPTASGDDPFETDGAYDPTAVPEGETGDTTGDVPPGDTTGNGVDPSGPWDPTTGSGDDGSLPTGPDASDAGTDGSSTSQGDRGEETESAGPEPAFPAPPPFGDDAAETALVGTWTVAWNPNGTPHWSLDVGADGSFAWTEVAAGCNEQASAQGRLWLEGDEMVLHVEAWDKRDPWPVESVVGEPLATPFRLHLSYAMALGMLSVSGPWELTSLLGWEGRVYLREPSFGPAGIWTSSASLEAVVQGEDAPRVIVRDDYTMETAGGAQMTKTTLRTWTHGDAPIEQPPIVQTGTWFNQSPGQPSGMIWIAGTTHLFDDRHLVAFDEDRVFYEEAPAGCD